MPGARPSHPGRLARLDAVSAPSTRPAASHHPLDDARLKVNAAQQNFDALKTTIEEYASSRPYSVGVAYDASKRQHLIHVPAPPALPREWWILVGQLGTNARAALDYLVYELSVYGHGDPDKDRTQFPISESQDDYLRSGRGGITYRDRSLAGVDERFRRRIDDLQPYHRRKSAHRHPLALLAKLTNRDTHDHPRTRRDRDRLPHLSCPDARTHIRLAPTPRPRDQRRRVHGQVRGRAAAGVRAAHPTEARSTRPHEPAADHPHRLLGRARVAVPLRRAPDRVEGARDRRLAHIRGGVRGLARSGSLFSYRRSPHPLHGGSHARMAEPCQPGRNAAFA